MEIDNRLLDRNWEPELNENFNRLLRLIDTNTGGGSNLSSYATFKNYESESKAKPNSITAGIKIEKSTLTEVVGAGLYDDVNVKIVSNNRLGIDGKYDTINKNVTDMIVEGVDFKTYCITNNVQLVLSLALDQTITFINCLFSSVVSNMTPYVDGKIKFINCEFDFDLDGKYRSIQVGNCKFNNCTFHGINFDGLYLYSDTIVNKCYFYDLSKYSGNNHLDCIQINGLANYTIDNITIINSRFEFPPILHGSDTTGHYNNCIFISAQRGNLSNITVKNCILNGGAYALAFCDCVDIVDNETINTLTNSSINIKYGCSHRSGILYPSTLYNDNFTDWCTARGNAYSAKAVEELYVTSISNNSNGTSIIVTNDTNSVRKLKIVTNLCEEIYDIPAYKLATELVNGTSYSDLGIDYEITIPKCDWVRCYDITDITEEISLFNKYLTT